MSGCPRSPARQAQADVKSLERELAVMSERVQRLEDVVARLSQQSLMHTPIGSAPRRQTFPVPDPAMKGFDYPAAVQAAWKLKERP